ncbi:hypothetical protein EVAR_88271_1 [Eumeta japonica]|uniref:Uncharacterized protein n=1 Tax=Eumeta variegata TaxID=151549 RepID=A0A4C1XLI7_EUMVA|nr:hypothetical protein EVAR_88271_1 [Eumeta japonica]
MGNNRRVLGHKRTTFEDATNEREHFRISPAHNYYYSLNHGLIYAQSIRVYTETAFRMRRLRDGICANKLHACATPPPNSPGAILRSSRAPAITRLRRRRVWPPAT